MDKISQLFLDLDRSGPVPLYFQLARRIEAAIERGDLPPGSKLENEIKLAEELGLSRPTVRRAIQELVDTGLLVRRRGVGTQVVHGRVNRKVELTSLYDDLKRSNMSPTTMLLLHEVAPAPDEVVEALGITTATPVLRIKRLRYANETPFALLENFLSPQFSDLDVSLLHDHGLYQLLRTRGTTMRVAKQRIGARAATAEEGALFHQPVGSPVLTMSRTLYDDSGNAIEFGNHSYLPDMYSFEITLVEK
ncbi:GntR family transcriptional regulator [Microbacterium protaetiae]|uniref:GntR family transcriptional regulator n=1 Tax=Microbacterium protaetiae TaxID=2509458 RepID=A0A4V0YD21_9MICO|nr:GntR family transcriptional regulator [Microbacterium protaetiae]QAY59191.1 GntR family transcriptional regulator [Microbacterium protaetiae]